MRRITLTMACAALVLTVAGAAEAVPEGPSPTPIDIGFSLRGIDAADVPLYVTPDGAAVAAGASSSGGAPTPYMEGDVVLGLWYDDYSGLYLAPFEVRAIGEHVEVWVMTDLDYPEGDPRNPISVTDDQIDYLVEEFDTVIYPNNTAFFGQPEFHDGSGALFTAWGFGEYYDEDGRTIMMISNIGDGNYWDPTYPYYIAGFYWGVFEAYLDRNVISIDALDWANRVGDDDAPWRGPDPAAWRPNLYEGVIAHELQHLIHDDVDADEEIWVNEGCADFAEFLNGYGHPDSHVSSFLSHAENSLVLWTDQGDFELLADYGNAYLWTLYLAEQYGQSFIQDLVNNPGNGIAGVNSTLAAHRSHRDFADVYHDYQVALLVDSDNVRCDDDDCFGDREEGAPNPFVFQNIDVNVDFASPEASSTPGAPPWGTDYVLVGDPDEVGAVAFAGMDTAIFETPWLSNGSVIWGGDTDEADNFAIFETVGGGTLSFETYYDIEPYWDFGFVQVSNDGGETWTSLENAYTTYDYEPGAYPTVVENLPGLTGWSEGWVSMSFALPYPGEDILVAFRYVTDWVYTNPGWYIDNVAVDGELISDCSSTAAFMDISELIPTEVDFTVRFVGVTESRRGNRYQLYDLSIDDLTETGIADLWRSDYVIMLVDFDAPQGASFYAPYAWEARPEVD